MTKKTGDSAPNPDDLKTTLNSMTQVQIEPLMAIDEVCAAIGIPKSTLYTWRTTKPGYGPRAIRIGRSLRWRCSEVERWLDSLPADEPFEEGAL